MSFSLGLSSGGGNYIRFSPSINAWTLGKDEITIKKILFDMETIRTGWGLMAEGQAPQWVWDEAIGRRSAKPDGDYKRGFSVRVYLGPDKGWAEWSSNGTGPCMGFEALAAKAMPDAANHPDQVLVCSYTGSRAEKVGKGNTRVPQFEILGWIDRPSDDADEAPAPAPAPVAQRAAPPATGSRAVPPPSKAVAFDADFG